ncbi:MAG: T9SS type A sorting domain-containing protein [Ignavibacterium sp.]|nr:T9SS type A sorting domain-containing protein [Ignavibacterium sp.]
MEVEISIPTRFSLNQNFPNPFNPVTSIQYAIANKQFVTLKVYDILGKEITTLVNENKEAGNYSVDFNAAELPSGVYIYQLSTADFTQIKKMILTK